MKRTVQFAAITLALGSWNIASAQTAPGAKPVTAQTGKAAARTTVAQAAEDVGGATAGAETAGVAGAAGGGIGGLGVGASFGLAVAVGAIIQATTDSGTTAPASHSP